MKLHGAPYKENGFTATNIHCSILSCFADEIKVTDWSNKTFTLLLQSLSV